MIAVVPHSTEPEIERATRHTLDTMAADGSTPGFQYVFASDQAVLFSHHGGAADLLTPRAVTEHSTFNAYSVTKTFTAAAVMLLAERRLVDLDHPIARYLDRWPHCGAATVRQTLLHTAGFANPNPLRWVHLAEEHAAFDRDRFVEEVSRADCRPVSQQARLTDEILAAGSRAALFKNESAPGPTRSLGGFTGQLGQADWFARAGGGAGYYSEIRVYPQLSRASVLMLNRPGIRDERLLDRLDRHLIEQR